MTRVRVAYLPLATYPEAIADEPIRAAAGFAGPLGCALSVTAFAVDLPRVSSGLGDLVLDIPALVHTAEEQSRAECHRLETFVREVVASSVAVHCATRKVGWGAVPDAASVEARYYDVTLLPWSGEALAAQDMAQAVIFGSGRPAVVVPSGTPAARLDHIAIAWDGSRVAARALGDALPFLAEGGRLSVLTVRDEKPLGGADLSGALASLLVKRGVDAVPVETTSSGRSIAEALQDAALSNGAQLLAMGGFGHSRLRDFVLGGATKGILERLRLPILLSH